MTKKKITYPMSILIGIFVFLPVFLYLNIGDISNGKRNKMEIMATYEGNTSDTRKIADYFPVPLPRLIGMSDLVVNGSIEDTTNTNFTLRVDKVLRGDYCSEIIEIRQHVNSKFEDPRTVPYTKGQEFLLFLKRPDVDFESRPWKIIGLTGEGELPVQDSFVYLEGSNLEGIEHKPYEVQGVKRILQRINLDDFCDAVENYQACFSWELVEKIKNKKKRTRWIPSIHCSDTILKNYEGKSWIHEYLVQRTLRKIPVR